MVGDVYIFRNWREVCCIPSVTLWSIERSLLSVPVSYESGSSKVGSFRRAKPNISNHLLPKASHSKFAFQNFCISVFPVSLSTQFCPKEPMACQKSEHYCESYSVYDQSGLREFRYCSYSGIRMFAIFLYVSGRVLTSWIPVCRGWHYYIVKKIVFYWLLYVFIPKFLKIDTV